MQIPWSTYKVISVHLILLDGVVNRQHEQLLSVFDLLIPAGLTRREEVSAGAPHPHPEGGGVHESLWMLD